MPSLTAARNSNAAHCPSYVPVFVIFGGTSGIGEAMARAVASYTKGRAHIIIIGRNKVAAESIIASLYKPAEAEAADSHYEFVACDVLLMKNIDALARELNDRLPKINYLVLSAGVFGFGGREETEEGLDKKLASRFYSRFAILQGLLPLLRKAKNAGEDAGVLSVLGAGMSSAIDFDDLGLKKHYKGWRAMMHSLSYNDLMVEAFAEREPDIAFTHIYPGNVDTGAYKFKNWMARLGMMLLRPLLWLILTTPEDCAEYMVYGLFNGEKGMYRRNEKGDDIGMNTFPTATNDQKKQFWDHCVASTSGKWYAAFFHLTSMKPGLSSDDGFTETATRLYLPRVLLASPQHLSSLLML